jgi:DNA replication protein DnaC
MSNYVKMMNNVESLHLDSWKGRIDAVIDAINSGSMDVVDGLYSLTDAEVSERQKRVDVAMVKVSHFPFQKTFADYDFSFQPQLKKEEITDLGNLRFVEARENVVFLGTPGTGKTHLSVAIGIEAAKSRYRTYFATCNDLIADQEAEVLLFVLAAHHRRGRVPSDR